MPNLYVVRAKIVAAANSQLGVPYVYGGTTPGVGFDCSGLAQWCCARAGIAIPRGSAAQFGASGPRVDRDIQPGDLVFFYGAPNESARPGHVGIATSFGAMIDAPYTGTVVRFDSFVIGAHVGPLDFWGATRPAKLNTESETDVMYLLECNDSPYGDKSWFTLAGGICVHIPDPPTLNLLNAASENGDIVKVPGAVSWAWLSQYVPGKDTTA